jgi:hypothetical protein
VGREKPGEWTGRGRRVQRPRGRVGGRERQNAAGGKGVHPGNAGAPSPARRRELRRVGPELAEATGLGPRELAQRFAPEALLPRQLRDGGRPRRSFAKSAGERFVILAGVDSAEVCAFAKSVESSEQGAKRE